MELLKKYLKPLLKDMSISFLMKALGALAVLLLPYLLAYVIDSIVPMKDVQLIVIYGVIMIVVSVAVWIFDIMANRLASRVPVMQQFISGMISLKKQFGCPAARVIIYHPSLESRLTSDTYNVHRMIGMIQRMGVRAPILLIGGMIITLIMEPVWPWYANAAVYHLFGLLQSDKRLMFTKVQQAQDRMISVVRENAGAFA
ncbi:MAG: hypothetical protein ACLSA6_13340 [Holdemania massiliensis]